MKPNNEYDPFARIYNRYWGAEYRSKAFPILKRLLFSRVEPGARLLDVCCGTGQITAKAGQQGFELSGIDASDSMLAFARKNAPAAHLHLADVRDFNLGQEFDAAYSVFESLNHVPNIRALTKSFRNIRQHLKPRSPFLFDLNNEDAFGLYWNTVDALIEDDTSCVLRMDYDEKTRVGTCRFTAFELIESEWKRNDFTIRQTCHKGGDVLKALRAAGFENTTLYPATDAGMKGHTGFGRQFYLAFAGAA